jgi:hypothetical protein
VVDRDFSWLPPDGIKLTRDETAEVLVTLRALVDGTEVDEANRAHTVTIAIIVTRAIDRGGES